jgi:sulfur-carrier protein adenylyltransferase/sulfurtransferase
MAFWEYRKAAPGWTTRQLRLYLDDHAVGEYQLLDVRQPAEYRQTHIPGATLIPLGELDWRLYELDRGKPIIVYCASGVRSRAAASLLLRAGFAEVYSLEGGLDAWQGLTAAGTPNLGYFFMARNAAEGLALAWLLEEGARAFYLTLAERAENEPSLSGLFRELAEVEPAHQQTLVALCRTVTGQDAGAAFPYELLPEPPPEALLESGITLAEALHWSEGKDVHEILELALALETNAYDRYLRMYEEATQEESRNIFRCLAEEEKRHLRRLGEQLDRLLE